jgi:metallophosphoesterase (TIGR00282 family)
MRILFLGDIVGRVAREAVRDNVANLRQSLNLDFVIVNGENAAHGFGITAAMVEELLDNGVDVITTGNHVWDKSEILSYVENQPRLLRPINFPPGTPGKGAGLFTVGDKNILVINVMGQLFMQTLDDPFAAIEREISACPLSEMADAIIVDVHAEASSEKMAMGHFCDGRASLVVGTHTHIPTADAQILPAGTAYQTDAGMCGDYDSVIGMQKEESVNRFLTRMRRGRMEPANGSPTLCGVVVDTDDKTGLANSVEPVRVGGRLATTQRTS